MSEFSQWFSEQVTRRGRAASLSRLAEATGVSKSTVANWGRDENPSTPTWENCRGIALAFNVDREYVRRLAGYVDPDTDPVVSQETLSPEEAALVRSFRTGSQEWRDWLLAGIRVTQTTAPDPDEPPARPRRARPSPD